MVLRLIFLALAIPLFVAACGGSGGSPTQNPTQSAPTTAAIATSTAVPSGPGTITVGSTVIHGQSGRVLLVFVAPQGPASPAGRACIMIGSDSFTAPTTTMTEPTSGSDPCGGNTPAAVFPEGSYTVTAGIYAPPASTPDKTVTVSAQVRGNVAVVLDGASLSR